MKDKEGCIILIVAAVLLIAAIFGIVTEIARGITWIKWAFG